MLKMFLLPFIDKCILIIDVSASTFDIGAMMKHTIDLRNWALGAVVAAAVCVGANAGNSPVVTPPLLAASLFGAHSSQETAFQVMRVCVGQALDIAGAVTALAKQI